MSFSTNPKEKAKYDSKKAARAKIGSLTKLPYSHVQRIMLHVVDILKQHKPHVVYKVLLYPDQEADMLMLDYAREQPVSKAVIVLLKDMGGFIDGANRF